MGTEKIQLDLKLLRSLEPLSQLSVDKLTDILSKSVIEELPAGRILFRQGESDTRTYYLLSGQIELTIAGKRRAKTLKAKSSAAKSPIEQSLPRPCTARTKMDVATLAIDTSLLEILLCDDHLPTNIEVTELSAEIDAGDWMLRFLQSRAFLHLPTENIQSLLMRMEEVSVKRNQTIVQQGGKDKYYYIVKSGRCSVLRRLAPNAPEIELTSLSIGDGFGEEALIADSKRNATVRMLEDGKLMRLARQDFISLLVKPLLKYVDQHTVASLVKLRGTLLIDVRSHEEFTQNGIDGAINIPLSMLRTKIASLNTSHNYVVYCSDGSKSAAAAFLLNQQGIQCCILAGGLVSGRIVDATDRTKKQQAAAPVSSAPTTVNRVKTKNQTTVATNVPNCSSPVEQEILQLAASAEEDREMAEQRSKRLQKEANLIRKQAEALVKKTQTAEASRRKAEQAVQRHSESERQRLEAETARQQAEQKLRQLRSEAESAQKRQATLEKDRQQAKQQAKLAAKMAGEARTRAEEETRKLRAEAENIRSAAQQEAAQLRTELEASRLQMEEETKRARVQGLAAQKVSEAAEKAVYIKARQLAKLEAKKTAQIQAEAEATKQWAIEESARIRAEAALAKQQAEDEVEQAVRAKAEAEVAKQWAKEEMEKAVRTMAGAKQKQQIQKEAERTTRALAEAEQARRVAEAEEYAHNARIEAQNAAQAADEQEAKQALANKLEKKQQTDSVIFESGNLELLSEEISQSDNSFSLAKSSVKEDMGRIILEGERDIFIFERPTTADSFNEDEILAVSDCSDYADEDEEDDEQLPSFVVDTHSDSADVPEEVDIVFEDSIVTSQDKSVVQLSTIRKKAPPTRSFDGISRKTGNKYPFAAMAAGIIVVLTIGTFAIFNETYINMNKVIAWVTPQDSTEQMNTIKTRQLAQIVAAQLKAEKVVKDNAESEYVRLLKQWKKKIASQLATPQINTIEEKTNSN